MDAQERWPAHRHETRSWRQTQRRGSRDDRMLRDVTVSLPPLIAQCSMDVPARLVVDVEQAVREITALDVAYAPQLASLGAVLIRTESVASSEIENVEAATADYARALHGIKSNPAAVSMAGATAAIGGLVASVDDGRDINRQALLSAHAALMHDDPAEVRYAGKVRDVQNWLGGSDYSPALAIYVPPPPDMVDNYLDDLLAFANRTDIPVMVQAAIVHAQFESIHPFTDGNGRIGRALINTVLRRRGTTRRVVVPLAAALVADVPAYFALLDQYRDGDPAPIVQAVARAARVAARQSQVTAERIADLPARWRDAVTPLRAGSAVARILDELPHTTVLTADDAERIAGSSSAAYRAIDRLVDRDVIRPLTDRKRNQIWGVTDMLDELDDLALRIARDAVASASET